MLTNPNVYGGDTPFLLVLPKDRERVIRFFADAGVAMILLTEGTSLTRVELPGCNRAMAIRLVEQLSRRSRSDLRLPEPDDSPDDPIGGPFVFANRLRLRGLLDD